jgi:hypothetical protein
MTGRRWRFGLGVTFVVLAIAAYSMFTARWDSRRVASMLNVAILPPSVRHLSCEDEFSIDVGVACYFEIDPAEFPGLISRRAYTSGPKASHSHTRPMHPGPDFNYAVAYVASWETPPGTKQNHRLYLYVEADRHQVLLEYDGW